MDVEVPLKKYFSGQMADYKHLEKDSVPWSQIFVHNYFELITVHNG
jgi:hypothetical protein